MQIKINGVTLAVRFYLDAKLRKVTLKAVPLEPKAAPPTCEVVTRCHPSDRWNRRRGRRQAYRAFLAQSGVSRAKRNDLWQDYWLAFPQDLSKLGKE